MAVVSENAAPTRITVAHLSHTVELDVKQDTGFAITPLRLQVLSRYLEMIVWRKEGINLLKLYFWKLLQSV
jgi:hypothetical protein